MNVRRDVVSMIFSGKYFLYLDKFEWRNKVGVKYDFDFCILYFFFGGNL